MPFSPQRLRHNKRPSETPAPFLCFKWGRQYHPSDKDQKIEQSQPSSALLSFFEKLDNLVIKDNPEIFPSLSAVPSHETEKGLKEIRLRAWENINDLFDEALETIEFEKKKSDIRSVQDILKAHYESDAKHQPIDKLVPKEKLEELPAKLLSDIQSSQAIERSRLLHNKREAQGTANKALFQAIQKALTDHEKLLTLPYLIECIKHLRTESEITSEGIELIKKYLERYGVENVDAPITIYVDPEWDDELVGVQPQQKEDILIKVIASVAKSFEAVQGNAGIVTSLFVSRIVKIGNEFKAWFVNNTSVSLGSGYHDTHDARAEVVVVESDHIKIVARSPDVSGQDDSSEMYSLLLMAGLKEADFPSVRVNELYRIASVKPADHELLAKSTLAVIEAIVKDAMQADASADDDVKAAKEPIAAYQEKLFTLTTQFQETLKNTETNSRQLLDDAEVKSDRNIILDRVSEAIPAFEEQLRKISTLGESLKKKSAENQQAVDKLIDEFENQILEAYRRFQKRADEDDVVLSDELAQILVDAINAFVTAKLPESLKEDKKKKIIQEINERYKNYFALDEKGSAADDTEGILLLKKRTLLVEKINQTLSAFSQKKYYILEDDFYKILKSKIDQYIKEHPQNAGVQYDTEQKIVQIKIDEGCVRSLVYEATLTEIAARKKKLIAGINAIQLDAAGLQEYEDKINGITRSIHDERDALKKIIQYRRDVENDIASLSLAITQKLDALLTPLSDYGVPEEKLPKSTLKLLKEAKRYLRDQVWGKVNAIQVVLSELSLMTSAISAHRVAQNIESLKQEVSQHFQDLDETIRQWRESFDTFVESVNKKLNALLYYINKITLQSPYYWYKRVRMGGGEPIKVAGDDYIYKVPKRIQNIMLIQQKFTEKQTAADKIKCLVLSDEKGESVNEDDIDSGSDSDNASESVGLIKQPATIRSARKPSEMKENERRPSFFGAIKETINGAVHDKKTSKKTDEFMNILCQLQKVAEADALYDEEKINVVCEALVRYRTKYVEKLNQARPTTFLQKLNDTGTTSFYFSLSIFSSIGRKCMPRGNAPAQANANADPADSINAPPPDWFRKRMD